MTRPLPEPSAVGRDASNAAIAAVMNEELATINRERSRLMHELAMLRKETTALVAACVKFDLRRGELLSSAQKLGITLETTESTSGSGSR